MISLQYQNTIDILLKILRKKKKIEKKCVHRPKIKLN